MSPNKSAWHAGTLVPVIPGRLLFTAHASDEQTIDEIRSRPKYFFCSTDLQDSYAPFVDDFGPVNIGIVVEFCDYIRGLLKDKRLEHRTIVYYCTDAADSVANTVFLLAAFLMLEHKIEPAAAVAPFTISQLPVVPFRDASNRRSTFPLTVLDCLNGLNKAVACKWFSLEEFSLEEYIEYGDPTKGDLHVVCPKFVAFRGPSKTDATCPTLSIEAYIELLRELGVSNVIRLSAPDGYDKQSFFDAGFQHTDLPCATALPSDQVVREFLRACEQPVCAVHCASGLAHTGTMIALWMILRQGFSAKEAIAWMRLVRPGSVVGLQQHFLQEMELRFRVEISEFETQAVDGCEELGSSHGAWSMGRRGCAPQGEACHCARAEVERGREERALEECAAVRVEGRGADNGCVCIN
mmetsp:Transcript_9784/g.23251  ORF Transcript_9784/g.23251 Transcript_9784/m.23251 type:complete len:409 (+) Transcript_9784:74-1300(+)